MKTYERALTLEEMSHVQDEDIDTSDIPELDNSFWERAILIPAPGKERLTLRLDNYVLDYFKRRGRGYQSRINAVLRAYVEAQVRADHEEKGRHEALKAATNSDQSG